MVVKKTVSKYPLDWSGNAGLLQAAKGIALDLDDDGYLKAVAVAPFTSNSSGGITTNNLPATIVDPINTPGSPNPASRCFGDPATAGVLDTIVGLMVNSRRMSYSYVFGKWVGIIDYSSKTASSVHTAKVITLTPLQTSGQKQNMTIIVTCSAGTATLLFEVSPDNTTWITVDTLGAAATNILNYIPTSVGGTTAINPLAFPYMRITAGDAGVGNTTTTSIALK